MRPLPAFLEICRWLRPALFAGAVVLYSGCSVDMFSKVAPDPEVSGREKYRTLRPECAGLKISRPELDPATFRSLISCFGANGSIPEISKLVSGASDSTLVETVDLLNTAFLANAEIRDESRTIVRSLQERGRWEPVLAGLAPMFKDPERTRALFRLLSLGERDPLVIKTVQGFDPENSGAGLELLSRVVNSKAFGSLLRKIKAQPLSESERDRLLTLLTDFLRRQTQYRSADALVTDLAAGRGASIWNFAFGEGSTLLDTTSRFTLLLRDFSGPDGIRRIGRFHRGFHHPISCWGGGKVFAEPWKNLTDELKTHATEGTPSLQAFVTRFATVTALGIRDLCEIPEEYFEHYPAVARFTAGRTGGSYIGLLEKIFIGGMGESAGYFVGEWGESLADALGILEPKPWFGDLVLLFAELDGEDRDLFARWTRSLLSNRVAWNRLLKSWQKKDLSPVFSDLGILLSAEPSELRGALDSIEELFGSSDTHPWFQGWKQIATRSGASGVVSLTELPEFPEAARAIGEMLEDGRLGSILGDVLDLLAGGNKKNRNPVTLIEPLRLAKKSPRHSFVGEDLKPIESWAVMDDSQRACTRLDPRRSVDEQWETYRACLSGGGVPPSAFAGLEIARSWKIDGDSKPFFDSFVESWVKLPLTLSDRRAMIAAMSDLRAEDFLSILRGVEFPKLSLSLLGRFQSGLSIGRSTWDSFFSKIRVAIDDPRFAPLGRALREVFTQSEDVPGVRTGPASNPPPEETAAWVRDLECLNVDPRARVEEISREFSEAVLGWERPGGKLPLEWSAERLRPRVEAFAETLGSSLVQQNLLRWLSRLDPHTAAKWFYDRGRDPQLVAVMDPESRHLRVRWMTSLDRLESILVNSDFTYLLNGNYGLKFIGKFAEAWGDEPRSQWPLEIQARYSGSRTPPKLSDVLDEIVSFLSWFERFGGVPSAPDCVARDGKTTKRALLESRVSAPDLLIPFEVKAKAFNLKQTLSVVRENLPGSGAPTDGGMRLLRDLFWAIYSSAPKEDRDPGKADQNPLRFFQRLGDLGGLRSISRGLQSREWASERDALEESFSSLSRLVSEPAFGRLVSQFLSRPTDLGRVVERAFRSHDFEFGNLSFNVLNGISMDRDLRVAPVVARFFDRPIPFDLFTDAVTLLGELKDEGPSRLKVFKSLSPENRKILKTLPDYLEKRVFTAFLELPVNEALELLGREPGLRADLFHLLRGRQSDGDPRSPESSTIKVLSDLLFSEDHPEFRRAIGLWCGQSAGRFTEALASHPDESSLMVDGLLQASQSATFEDFLDSLLRQLPH